MNKLFLNYIAELPNLMEKLNKSDLIIRGNLQNIPEKGIYVFYEDMQPMYTGRSNNIKARIQYHCRPSSGHGSATFAFILAKESAVGLGVDISLERKLLENDQKFKEEFNKAKQRVSKMPIKAVYIEDPILQTLFEVYAALELPTKYNVFDTH